MMEVPRRYLDRRRSAGVLSESIEVRKIDLKGAGKNSSYRRSFCLSREVCFERGVSFRENPSRRTTLSIWSMTGHRVTFRWTSPCLPPEQTSCGRQKPNRVLHSRGMISQSQYSHSTHQHFAYGEDIVTRLSPSEISFPEVTFANRTDVLRHPKKSYGRIKFRGSKASPFTSPTKAFVEIQQSWKFHHRKTTTQTQRDVNAKWRKTKRSILYIYILCQSQETLTGEGTRE